MFRCKDDSCVIRSTGSNGGRTVGWCRHLPPGSAGTAVRQRWRPRRACPVVRLSWTAGRSWEGGWVTAETAESALAAGLSDEWFGRLCFLQRGREHRSNIVKWVSHDTMNVQKFLLLYLVVQVKPWRHFLKTPDLRGWRVVCGRSLPCWPRWCREEAWQETAHQSRGELRLVQRHFWGKSGGSEHQENTQTDFTEEVFWRRSGLMNLSVIPPLDEEPEGSSLEELWSKSQFCLSNLGFAGRPCRSDRHMWSMGLGNSTVQVFWNVSEPNIS